MRKTDITSEVKPKGKKDILNFGNYKGKRVEDVLFENPEYIIWCDETIEWLKIDRLILYRALDMVLELEAERKKSRDDKRRFSMTQESSPYWSEALQDNDY